MIIHINININIYIDLFNHLNNLIKINVLYTSGFHVFSVKYILLSFISQHCLNFLGYLLYYKVLFCFVYFLMSDQY